MFKSQSKFKRTLSKVIFCFAFVIPCADATSANPKALCNDMNVLIEQARLNFSEKAANGTSVTNTRPQLGAEKCTVARTLSGTITYHCAWGFLYRDVEANSAFEAFNRSMRSCFGDDTAVAKDQGVNHPDFYDQRRYQLDQVVVSVSIKDKSELQRTYVFIGVQGAVVEQ